jgi:hypothetical protein
MSIKLRRDSSKMEAGQVNLRNSAGEWLNKTYHLLPLYLDLLNEFPFHIIIESNAVNTKLEDAFKKKRMSPPLLRITVNGNRNGNEEIDQRSL